MTPKLTCSCVCLYRLLRSLRPARRASARTRCACRRGRFRREFRRCLRASFRSPGRRVCSISAPCSPGYGISVTMIASRSLPNLFGRGFGAHLQRAAALGEIIVECPAAQDEAAGGEIRALHHFMIFGRCVADSAPAAMVASMISVRLCGGMLVAMPTAMPDAAVDQQVRNARGQNFRLTSLSS
jgi:hypothetical protein